MVYGGSAIFSKWNYQNIFDDLWWDDSCKIGCRTVQKQLIISATTIWEKERWKQVSNYIDSVNDSESSLSTDPFSFRPGWFFPLFGYSYNSVMLI